MMSTSETPNPISLNKDTRRQVADAFDALAHWRDEISAANERCLAKAVDRMAAAQRAIGWPEHAIGAAKAPLLKTAQVQTHMIDQIMDAWERQLKSVHDLSGLPEAQPRAPEPSGSAFGDPVSGMVRLSEMALVPFKLWVEAAEAWQRNWADLMSARTAPHRKRPDEEAD
jgi:hypothetical protein